MNRAKMPGIYRIDLDLDFYVGSSINMEKRFKEHLQLLRRGCHSNPLLSSAWGACSNPSFSVLQCVDVFVGRNTARRDIDKVLKPLEWHWIQELSPTLNTQLERSRLEIFCLNQK